jgi:hypothetical protein
MMIDFENKGWFKLKENSTYSEKVKELLVLDEEILGSYSSMRDGVVFTSKRIIVINVQGVIGKKVDYTSIPYAKINVYSIETSGTFDLDAELDLFISGMGKLRFEFSGRANIKQISKYISQNIF